MYRVILADDLEEYLEWLRSLLEGCQDFEVVATATTGTEALRLVESLMPELVIADIDMPELDGLDVARFLKCQRSDIKVILISSHPALDYEMLAEEEGALAFIPKEVLSLDALRQVLQREG